ncbi:MAG: hypothetical protein QXT64_05390 [Desulfurococcaceae archaeon]
MMIARIKLKSITRNETKLRPMEIETEVRRLLTTGFSRRLVRLYSRRRRKFEGLAVTAVAWSNLREPVYYATGVNGEELEGFRVYTADATLKLTPLLKLPREIRVNVLDRVEAVVEVEPCRIVEVVRRLWETATGSEVEKLVAVYVEMRKRGLPLTVKTIGELVGANPKNVRRARSAVEKLRLFTVKPERELVEKTLVELGVPEDVARSVAARADKREYWTIHRLAGCLHTHGLTYNAIRELLGVSSPTTRKYSEDAKHEHSKTS